jgi:hypothetical protein
MSPWEYLAILVLVPAVYVIAGTAIIMTCIAAYAGCRKLYGWMKFRYLWRLMQLELTEILIGSTVSNHSTNPRIKPPK